MATSDRQATTQEALGGGVFRRSADTARQTPNEAGWSTGIQRLAVILRRWLARKPLLTRGSSKYEQHFERRAKSTAGDWFPDPDDDQSAGPSLFSCWQSNKFRAKGRFELATDWFSTGQ